MKGRKPGPKPKRGEMVVRRKDGSALLGQTNQLNGLPATRSESYGGRALKGFFKKVTGK